MGGATKSKGVNRLVGNIVWCLRLLYIPWEGSLASIFKRTVCPILVLIWVHLKSSAICGPSILV